MCRRDAPELAPPSEALSISMGNKGDISAASRFDQEFFKRPPHTRPDERHGKAPTAGRLKSV
jgi:hypothetical protein